MAGSGEEKEEIGTDRVQQLIFYLFLFLPSFILMPRLFLISQPKGKHPLESGQSINIQYSRQNTSPIVTSTYKKIAECPSYPKRTGSAHTRLTPFGQHKLNN